MIERERYRLPPPIPSPAHNSPAAGPSAFLRPSTSFASSRAVGQHRPLIPSTAPRDEQPGTFFHAVVLLAINFLKILIFPLSIDHLSICKDILVLLQVTVQEIVNL